MEPENANQILEDNVYKTTGLIAILEKIQSKYSYLPEKELKEVAEKNSSLPIATIALGKAISITGLMGLMLKGDQELTTMIEGDGPLGKIISIANAVGETRAIVTNPQAEAEHTNLTVKDAVGE